MNPTRRNFLRAGTVSALFAGLSLSPAKLLFGQKRSKSLRFDTPYESKTNPVFYFNQATFAPYVNTEFQIFQPGAQAGEAVRLTEVFDFQKQLKARRLSAHGGECFSLSFHSPSTEPLPQGTYRMKHPALGKFSLFLVPGRVTAEGVSYEAVINHLA